MLSVLTPTGARPEAFAACVAMMRAQDYPGPVVWVIVDDGPEPMAKPDMGPWRVQMIRPVPLWRPGQNTLGRNILAGLDAIEAVGCDRVVIVEDDDAYAAWWLRQCDEWLAHADLVGESHSLYRHRVSGREQAMGNDAHASLCSTALKGCARADLRTVAAAGSRGIDMRLWRAFRGTKRLYRPEPRGVTGIKGWPGRPGIGVGHRLT